MSSTEHSICCGRFRGAEKSIKGATLFEILVAAALTLLLLSMVVSFLIPTMRYSIKGSVTAEIQQEALRAVNRICRDLESSGTAGVSLFSPESGKGPLYPAIIRLSDVLPDGARAWEDSLTVYSWKGPGEPLIQKVWDASCPPHLEATIDSAAPSRFSQSDLAAIAEEQGLPGKTLVRDVSYFAITCPDSETVGSPLKINITINREAAAGGTNTVNFGISRTINLRNQ
ncbi:MAG: hypothetical protein AB9903_01405 [Vulcanimicrobiota bacterium]